MMEEFIARVFIGLAGLIVFTLTVIMMMQKSEEDETETFIYKRDTPQKPIDVQGQVYKICPNCKKAKFIAHWRYCNFCGQKLDWSDN